VNAAADARARSRPRIRAPLVAAVAVVAGVLGVATVREIAIGARAVADADAALEQGDAAGAVAAARAAAEAVAPGSPYPSRGYARLEGIAKDAEARGDAATATSAWAAMRAAASATRGPLVRTAPWQEEAEEGLLRVGAHPAPAPGRPNGDVAPSEETLLASLRRNDTPPTLSYAALAAGAIAFFGGLARLAWLAGEPLTLRRARLPGIVAACGLVVYALACLRG
jgi:hypothetical protein